MYQSLESVPPPHFLERIVALAQYAYQQKEQSGLDIIPYFVRFFRVGRQSFM